MRNTLRLLVAGLIAAFALASTAEAAAPKKTRHRAPHSSRVASGAVATTGKKPAAKKKASTPKSGAAAKSSGTKPAAKKSSSKRPAPTKPR